MVLQLKRVRLAATPAPTWLAWLVPVFAWAGLTYPGYFEFHSGFAPVFNLTDLARHFPDFTWAPVAGQSYDLLRGEGALPYLLALMPHTLGFPGATSIKLVFAAGMLAGALGTFAWARRRLGSWPALLAAAVYVFWPLGLATVYVRGALAETLLLGFMPWLFWAADGALGIPSLTTSAEAGELPSLRFAGTLAALVAASFWTQAGLALWLAALVAVYIFVAGKGDLTPNPSRCAPRDAGGKHGRKQSPGRRGEYYSPFLRREGGRGVRFFSPILGWLGGLAAGWLGLLPLLLRRGAGSLGAAAPVFGDHLVYPHQLLLASWGYGPSVPGADDDLTFQLGLVACGLALLGVVLWREAAQRAHRSEDAFLPLSTFIYFATGAVLVPALLSSTLVAPLWGLLGFASRTLTYPWQLLLLAGPWLAWLAGLGGRALLDLLDRGEAIQEGGEATGQAGLPLFAGLLVLALLGSYGDMNPPTTPVPVPEEPLAILGNHEIALLAAIPFGIPAPGQPITATVRWQALRPLSQDYTVFFQAIGPDGTLWGQQDTMPQDGKLPTSQWRPGEIVTDEYRLVLKPDAPAGADYQYVLGFYEWQTGQRLRNGDNDKVVLGK